MNFSGLQFEEMYRNTINRGRTIEQSPDMATVSRILRNGRERQMTNKLANIGQYCDIFCKFLRHEAEGLTSGTDFLGTDGEAVEKMYSPVELWCRSIEAGKLLYGLVHLCMTDDICPPAMIDAIIQKMVYSPVKLGSGIDMQSRSWLMCGNWNLDEDRPACNARSLHACSDCMLVSYCSKRCKLQHRPVHERVCKKATADEARAQLVKEHGREKVTVSLYARVPAVGLLGKDESEEDDQHRFCFEDCYDLNNVVETFYQMDKDCRGNTVMYMNCSNHQALARNIILCCMLCNIAKGTVDESGYDAVIAVWYSAYLTPWQYNFLMSVIHRLLYAVSSILPCRHPEYARVFVGDSDHTYLQQHQQMDTWSRLFEHLDASTIVLQEIGGPNPCSIRVRLQGLELWKYVMAMTMLPWESKDLEPSRQESLRRFDTSVGVERFLVGPQKEAVEQFRHSGILLPFSQFSGHHTLPNPTLFSEACGWTAQSSALDPLSGWPINEVVMGKQKSGAPCNDLYGSLYFYVRERLVSVVQRMKKGQVVLEFSDKKTEMFLHDLHYKHYAFGPVHRAIWTQPSLETFLHSWADLLQAERGQKKGGKLIIWSQLPEEDMGEGQVKAALSKFDDFIAGCSDPFATQLRKYADAIREGRAGVDRLSPFFRHDLTRLRERYLDLQASLLKPRLAIAVSEESAHVDATYSLPCAVLGKGGSNEVEQLPLYPPVCFITTAEESYNEVLLTLRSHASVYTEWEVREDYSEEGAIYRGIVQEVGPTLALAANAVGAHGRETCQDRA